MGAASIGMGKPPVPPGMQHATPLLQIAAPVAALAGAATVCLRSGDSLRATPAIPPIKSPYFVE
jgi:hypothetical protein